MSRSVATIIWARWIVPVRPAGLVLENHGLAIDEDRIVGLVSYDDRETWHAEKEYRLPRHALMPGLVNAHTHAPMVLLRGVGDDLPLERWLEDEIWPREGRFADAQFVADGARHAMAEMLRGGTTCAKDQYFFPEAAIAVARDVGFRYIAGSPLVEFPTRFASDASEYLAKAERLLTDVSGDPLVGASVSPHAPYTVSDDSFVAAKRLSERFDVVMDVHTHETQGEVDRAFDQYGERPLSRLDRLGLLDAQFMAVHMTALNDSEIALIARRGATVAHCIESNLKLASGFCPVGKLLEAGVTVGIGTDSAASNNDLDMLGETRTAALVAKAVASDAGVMPAATALEMATLGSASALGLGDKIGSLEPGKQADVVAIDLSPLETQPMDDVVSHLVYAASRFQVTDVWIAGRRLLADRELMTIDAGEVVHASRQWRKKMDQQEQSS